MTQHYSLEQINKEETKSKNITESEIIEQENYTISKLANEKLEKMMKIQKETSLILDIQGEKIDKIKEVSLNVLKKTEEVKSVNKTIINESSMWGRPSSIFDGFFNWLYPENKHKKEVEKIKNKQANIPIREKIDENNINIENSEEYVKGENLTHMEWDKMLNNIKHINREAEYQVKTIKNQNSDLNDIKRINEISKNLMDETENKIKEK